MMIVNFSNFSFEQHFTEWTLYYRHSITSIMHRLWTASLLGAAGDRGTASFPPANDIHSTHLTCDCWLIIFLTSLLVVCRQWLAQRHSKTFFYYVWKGEEHALPPFYDFLIICIFICHHVYFSLFDYLFIIIILYSFIYLFILYFFYVWGRCVLCPLAPAGGLLRLMNLSYIPPGFSDPYCMLGIQPAIQTALPGSPRDVYGLAQSSPPPDSPRNRHFSGVSLAVVCWSTVKSLSSHSVGGKIFVIRRHSFYFHWRFTRP